MGHRQEVGAESGGIIVLLPAPSMGDWSRAAPLMEDVRLGFLIKLHCLFHLRPYFLKVAFLNHVLCLCGLETSLLTPHPPHLPTRLEAANRPT